MKDRNYFWKFQKETERERDSMSKFKKKGKNSRDLTKNERNLRIKY